MTDWLGDPDLKELSWDELYDFTNGKTVQCMERATNNRADDALSLLFTDGSEVIILAHMSQGRGYMTVHKRVNP